MRVRRGVYSLVSTGIKWRPDSRLPKILITAVVLLLLVILITFVSRTTRATPPCPCNVFTASQPSTAPSLFSQPGGIEVGFKFKAEINGYISGVRFYKVAGMTGTHTGSLWNAAGLRIAQATFTGEGSTGWQEVTFSPVAVTANTIYTASVFMADGGYSATSNYFTSDIINSPLTAPKDGDASDNASRRGQGVYNVSGTSVYPFDSFNKANYWIDVAYIGSNSATPPGVLAQTPLPNTTNVTVTDDLSATFDQPLDPATIGANSLVLKDSNNNVFAVTATYDATTYMVKFSPTNTLQANMAYTATLTSGATGLTDLQGRHLAVDSTWSFTTSATSLSCPCSMKDRQNPSGSTTARDGATYASGIELGLKVIPRANGYITALRFYKPIITPDTSHTGHIWDSSGNSLASVTFTNESDYGWQEATLASPLSVVKNRLYVISYGMTTADYQASNGVFSTPMISPSLMAYPSGDARNMATGSGTANTVYAVSPNTYPTQSGLRDYYVDAVFAKQTSDVIPPQITNTQPSDKSYGVLRSTIVSASLDQPLDGTTVTNSTVKVYDGNNNLVSGIVAYDAGKRAITFSPSSTFAYNTTYSIHISSLVQDVRGLRLSADYRWSFTTGSQLITDITTGKGGPILVVTSAASAYGKYYAEILRAEGFNYFDVKDISTITAATLQGYKTVILADMAVSQSQVDMFSIWTNTGGSFITMRPDKKFASLLGLTDTGQTATNQYLRTNVASAAGIGIVDTAIQYKTVADKYNRSGAEVVATLYSDSSTATVYPAATTRSVGTGTAMAFTYDLAQSVIGLHQGNKLWSGQDRDGDATIRSNDLFYGASTIDPQPDWLDQTKIDIPQADEQQRLLANMITVGMKKSLPAPRFWYLPDTQKAALVLAGDDHIKVATVPSTEQALNDWMNESKTGCSTIDWQCIRASHYIFAANPITPGKAAQYVSYGFEIGDHPSYFDTCRIFTSYAQLDNQFSTDLATWQAKYFNLPLQQTSRFHCYVWSDWDMMPRADQVHGIKYDLNTTAYPAAWVGGRSPLVNGSGMNMRLTDINGALLDVHQGVTNFDNVSANSTAIAATFDNALGVTGYYGIFGSHYDMTDSYAATLLSIAKSRNIPVISSQQALEWLSGRESSNFTQLASTIQGRETFTITAGEGAHGLQAMVPTSDSTGTLQSIMIGSQPVTYRTNVIKGVEYALFNAFPGDYTVMYSDFSPAVPTSPSNQANGQVIRSGSSIATTTDPIQAQPQSVSSGPALSTSSRTAESDRSNTQTRGVTPLQMLLIVGAVIVLIGGGAAIWFFIIRPRLS